MLKRLLYSLVFSLSIIQVNAQNQNGLAFDGVDDVVTVTNGSSFVANSTEMSMTSWIFPTNAAPAYPNFDGFSGFRNDVDADFYLVQVGATALEGRFRNSAGTAFTITSNILTLNAWQHIAMTYDGGYLRMYKNGRITDSIPANGSITNSTVNFLIGNVAFQNANFLLTGKMDETSLWSRKLTSSEIICMPSEGIDSTASGLKLLYRYNQGIGNGPNIGLTTLIDSKGNANGTLTNFALSGTTSNWVPGASGLVNNTTQFTCPGVPFVWNGNNYNAPGIFRDTLTSSAGCDSIVQLTLQLLFVDTAVIVNGGTLTANHVGTGYQWLNCNNGFAPIAGATSRNYTPTANGSYAVIVTQSGCTDTSSCYSVTNVGLNSVELQNNIRIQPTITYSTVNVIFATQLLQGALSVLDFAGKEVITTQPIHSQELQLDLSSMASGIYFIRITNGDAYGIFKVVKQ